MSHPPDVAAADGADVFLEEEAHKDVSEGHRAEQIGDRDGELPGVHCLDECNKGGRNAAGTNRRGRRQSEELARKQGVGVKFRLIEKPEFRVLKFSCICPKLCPGDIHAFDWRCGGWPYGWAEWGLDRLRRRGQ